MNITQVSRRFTRRAWGGTETVVLETSRRLLARQYETSLVCPNALDRQATEDFDGLRVDRVPYFYPYLGLGPEQTAALDRKGGNLFSFALMRRLLAMPRPDVYHLHTGKRLGGIVRTVARRRNVPYVVTLHGGYADVPDEERATWTEPTRGTLEWGKALGLLVGSRRVLEDAAHVICVGRGEAEALRATLPHDRVSYLPNGVDFGRFCRGDGASFRATHGIPSTRRLILSVARIDRQKSQLVCVDILDALRRRHDAHLLLVGPVTDEPYFAELQRCVRELRLTERVTIIPGLDPESSDLVDAYHAADAFVLPSVHEPFGIAAVEAWASGVPVVASRVGGLAHLVDDGRDGILFDPASPTEAVAGVDLLLSRPETGRHLVAEGRRRARLEFDWDRVVDRLTRVYESVTPSVGAHRREAVA